VECRLKRSFESSGVFGLVWFWRFCCVLAELDWDCEHVLDECLWWSDEGEDGQIGWPERGALASGVVSVFRVKFPSCCQHTKNNEDMQRHTHTHTRTPNDIWNALLAFIRLLHTLHQNRLLITAENNYW